MPQPGEHLASGRYELLGPLGEGGMAEVYRALDTRLGMQRAIKLLKPQVASRKSVLRRFEGEATTMAKLHHPNVVTVHDVVTGGDEVFMVMELVDGGCLVDWLERHGPMPSRLAVGVILHVLNGLSAAHEAGVVHRDIKPHNVLVSREGVPKISDFGIAHLSDQEHHYTRTGTVMGTWAYMPPEQRTSAKGVDATADLYAVGATLYALVCNTEPFDLYVTEGHAEMFGSLPPALVEVITRACRYKPEDRYQSAAEMAAALAAILPALPPNPPETAALGDGGSVLAALPGSGFTGDSGVGLSATLADTSPGARAAGAARLLAFSALAITAGIVAVIVTGGMYLSSRTVSGVAQTPVPDMVEAPVPDRVEAPVPIAAPAPAAVEPNPAPTPAPAPAPPAPRPVVAPAEPLAPVPAPAPVEAMPPEPEVILGQLKVNSIPWSTVFVDGAELRRTPVTGHALPVGPHEIRLVTAEGLEKTTTVSIGEGAQVFFCWRFDDDREC